MEPPPCVQNAMMKQDKKPFTYTPGGIDLSEIRSPRMARRIERNANWDGVTEAPRPPPQQSQNIGPLPPSTLAAMQPQMHVQVFPSGPPPSLPGARNVGVPPPPPPPQSNGNIPPPPPPPLQALPTQKVVTGDNQVVERPDMTKIIPDNPMALLRKTGGPKPRPTFVDEVFNKANQSSPIKTPPIQQQTTFNVQPQQQQIPQSPIKTPTLQRPKSFVEDSNNAQWSPPTPQQNNKPQPWSPPIQNSQQWSPPIIERQVEQQPVKTSTAHIGSLYIPPVNQQQKSQPPSPPKRDPQSPQAQSPPTPTLKEAPKPWQKQPQQNPELPPWAKKETNLPPSSQIQQEQSPPIQQQRPPTNRWSNQQPASPKLEPQQQQQSAPNAVYVTQPLVFQHPGPQPNRQQQQPPPPQQQQQKPKVDAQGARVIPIQIEGANQRPANKVNSPATPSNERSFNRQQSWNNTPTQSNSFKIIQKLTQTDDDDDGNENQQIIEHGPRYPQQFQQQQQQQQIPTEQMRKMKLSEGDRELMNKLKQGVDDENYLHNEIDPRYRGAAIPSKAFKLLQSMTDGTNDNSTVPSVSRGPAPTGNKQAQVRTIPIQIERDEPPQKYVPPSEQTVPEPKKYTGSAIPSRSFKILQAMTAPESCANANEVNEYNDPSSYYHWNYDPNYPPLPPPFPPFWPDYYHYYYSNYTNNNDNNLNNNKENDDKNNRQTPVPFWGYCPPPPPPPTPSPYMSKQSKSDTESDSETARNTPLPFWGGYFPGYYPPTPTPDREKSSQDYQQNYTQYPPYWDPYYYHNLYYYGYPPYGFYPSCSDTEDNNDEKTTKQFVEESKSITPTILVTPTIPEELQTKQEENKNDDEEVSVLSSLESDSETEVEDNEDNQRCSHPNGLQAIKSVADINVYDNNSDEDDVGEEEENSEETDSTSIYIIEDETIPHQLSVIFEESERTDISKREMSVFSDSTTIADKTDNEDDDDDEEEEVSVSISLPLRTVKTPEITASFTLKTPESSRAVSRTEDYDNEDNEEKEEPEKIEVENEDKGDGDNKVDDDDEQDWWGIINKNEDDFYPRKSRIVEETYKEPTTTSTTVDEDCEISKDINEDDNHSSSRSSSDDEDSSSSSSDSSSSKSITTNHVELKQIKDEITIKKKEPTKEVNCVENNENKDGDGVKMLTIKERIQALKESIQKKEIILKPNEEHKEENKESKEKEEEKSKNSVKEKVSAIETINGSNLLTTAAISTKSSVKSFEELSEEEGDSGVTSDMSRHISDTEEFPELRKMTRYQRAATHSRLYKLLQSECDDEDNDDDDVDRDNDKDQNRRNQLSLPLEPTNFDLNSNHTSPTSSINDKLINELVQSMLKRKKGQNFRHLPKEKLQIAAKRILQEEFVDDLSSTPDSSFLSPLRNNTESSTPAQTPQEFYNDYKQYYDTWNDYDNNVNIINNNNDSDNDVFPSKAFKLLQEHTGLNRTGAIVGLLAKCPKILSSKNVHQELIKLIEQSTNDPIDTNHDAS